MTAPVPARGASPTGGAGDHVASRIISVVVRSANDGYLDTTLTWKFTELCDASPGPDPAVLEIRPVTGQRSLLRCSVTTTAELRKSVAELFRAYRRGTRAHREQAAAVRTNGHRPTEASSVVPTAGGDTRAASPAELVSDAPIGGVRVSERKLSFRTAREIATATPARPRWVAKPWLAHEAITETTGKAKSAGKTTFVLAQTGAVLDGVRFMGEPTERGPVVYLTEERPATFREALRRAGLLERDDLYVLHWHETSGVAWPDVVAAAADKAEAVGAVLLVVDTVSQFANLKGEEEQAAGHALEAVAPLQAAAARGLAVLGIRHERKAGGNVGDAGRGSSAFAGAADIVLSLRRCDGNARPTARVIYSLSRFDETPDTLVIDLTPDGYIAVGSESEIAVAEAKQAILAVLPVDEDAAMTEKALLEALPSQVKRTSARKGLDALHREGGVLRTGQGRRGSAYHYSRVVKVSDTSNDPIASERNGCDHWPPEEIADRLLQGEEGACPCCSGPGGKDGPCDVCADGAPHQANASLRFAVRRGLQRVEGGRVSPTRPGTGSRAERSAAPP